MTSKKPAPDKVLETVSPDTLIPNPRNPNRHNADQVEGLGKSLAMFGQPRPIVVRTANRMIIAGHGIWQAARAIGRNVETVFWDCDQPTADAYMVADNRWAELSARDDDMVTELLRGVTPASLPALGFPADYLTTLDTVDPIAVATVDTTPVDDTFWISLRGPLKHQAAVLTRLTEVLADLPEVDVELGSLQL